MHEETGEEKRERGRHLLYASPHRERALSHPSEPSTVIKTFGRARFPAEAKRRAESYCFWRHQPCTNRTDVAPGAASLLCLPRPPSARGRFNHPIVFRNWSWHSHSTDCDAERGTLSSKSPQAPDVLVWTFPVIQAMINGSGSPGCPVVSSWHS